MRPIKPEGYGRGNTTKQLIVRSGTQSCAMRHVFVVPANIDQCVLRGASTVYVTAYCLMEALTLSA